MILCPWCGLPDERHTPGQRAAAAYFMDVVPQLAYNPDETFPSPGIKLSKSNQ